MNPLSSSNLQSSAQNGIESTPPSSYTAIGRAAVRAFLERRSGRTGLATAAEVLLHHLVPPTSLRLWILDDLLPDRRLERIARLAYPELVRDFAALDKSREKARQRRALELVGRQVDEAMRHLEA